jgi:hypothetical protein
LKRNALQMTPASATQKQKRENQEGPDGV